MPGGGAQLAHGQGGRSAMTENEFYERREGLRCRFCDANGLGVVRPTDHHPGGGFRCVDCGRFGEWFKLEKNKAKRERLKPGTIDRVWAAWGDVCACCNCSTVMLARLGITRTVQHVPAYKQVGHDARLIPFCRWCQDRSAAEMRRMETLSGRIVRSWDDQTA